MCLLEMTDPALTVKGKRKTNSWFLETYVWSKWTNIKKIDKDLKGEVYTEL